MQQTEDRDLPKTWVALAYRLPALPSRGRVYVWRKLKEAGAVSVQQSVAILPGETRPVAFMEQLRERIRSYGGEATLVEMRFYSKEDEEQAVEQFKSHVREDCSEVERVILKVLEELDCLWNTPPVSRVYLEEKVRLLYRLRTDYEKIRRRDYFRIARGGRAEKLLDRLEARLMERLGEADGADTADSGAEGSAAGEEGEF
jgi:hypothetical protein